MSAESVGAHGWICVIWLVCCVSVAGFSCTAWGNLSPREKTIHHLYTLSAGSSKAAVNLNYINPPPSTLHTSHSLACCHRQKRTKLADFCYVPRLTISFRLNLRGHSHVGVLPFVWTHRRVLPPQGPPCSLGECRGGEWKGVVMVVTCRTQHRLTHGQSKQHQAAVCTGTDRPAGLFTHTHTSTHTHTVHKCINTHSDSCWAVWGLTRCFPCDPQQLITNYTCVSKDWNVSSSCHSPCLYVPHSPSPLLFWLTCQISAGPVRW